MSLGEGKRAPGRRKSNEKKGKSKSMFVINCPASFQKERRHCELREGQAAALQYRCKGRENTNVKHSVCQHGHSPLLCRTNPYPCPVFTGFSNQESRPYPRAPPCLSSRACRRGRLKRAVRKSPAFQSPGLGPAADVPFGRSAAWLGVTPWWTGNTITLMR